MYSTKTFTNLLIMLLKIAREREIKYYSKLYMDSLEKTSHCRFVFASKFSM